MKKIIEIPEDLENYILLKAKELAYTMTSFFEYIVSPRDHYVEINFLEMKPHITEKMLSYCIQNILGIVIDFNTQYTANYDKILFLGEKLTEYTTNDFFIINCREVLKEHIEGLLKLEGYLFISTQAMELFINYLDHTLNQALLALTEGDLDTDLELAFKNSSGNINQILNDYVITDGDNVLFPKNYGFNEDEHNILIQSFIWVLCGLTDWLDKDYIDTVDFTYMKIILFGSTDFDKKINSKEVPDDITVTIKEAMFLNDFYINEKAVTRLNKLFNNINYYKGDDKDQLIKRVNQFSINI